MSEHNCPLCGCQSPCYEKQSESPTVESWHCHTYNIDVKIGEVFPTDSTIRSKALNLALEFLLRTPRYLHGNMEQDWYFICDSNISMDEVLKPTINLGDKLNTYPKELTEKIPRILDNIATFNPEYGDPVDLSPNFYRLLFIEERDAYHRRVQGVVGILMELGYLTKATVRDMYIITAKGWQEIDTIRRKNKESKQGFIAMSFRDETKSIREAFRSAIKESGFAVGIIDEKEHNNQIVPEIFYEIERSKFVVVDVTYPNYGAYYEAGYAQALGKQVIICCREQEFKSNDSRPHFDISQKSMIVWKDEEDLIARLKRRIEATVK